MSWKLRRMERAMVLAQEALPHLVESSVKALFDAEGMPVPPISVGATASRRRSEGSPDVDADL